MVDAAAVRDALERVVDPCSEVAGVPGGLVSMGLVREIVIEEQPGAGTTIRIVIRVTEPGCLMGPAFACGARERLEGLPGVSSVEIELDHRLDWEPGDMTPAYRHRLEAARAGRRGTRQVALLPTGGVIRDPGLAAGDPIACDPFPPVRPPRRQ